MTTVSVAYFQQMTDDTVCVGAQSKSRSSRLGVVLGLVHLPWGTQFLLQVTALLQPRVA